MRSFKDLVTKNLKSFFVLLGAFTLIVLFQNCGKNNFQTKSLGKIELASENTNNSSELPNADIPDSADDNQMREITDIFNDPRNENTSNAPVENAVTTGKVYYVSPSGDNVNNPGTSINKPFKTIAHAVSKMVAGDTTYVRGGKYSEPPRFGRSGTTEAPIKLLNAPGEFPVIDCENIVKHLVFQRGEYTQRLPIGHITLEGFEIRNCHHGMYINNGYNITIRRNWIHHNNAQGMHGNGINIVVDRNVINHNGNFAKCAAGALFSGGGTLCNKHHGIYTTGTNWKITNNLIYDNLSNGIVVAGYKHCPEGGCYGNKIYTDSSYGGADNWLIANNTIAYQHYRGAIVLWHGLTTNSKIINNIFYENSQKYPGDPNGVSFFGSGGGHVIKNNLSYATAPGGTACIGANGEGKYTQSGNIVNTLNPKFVNAPATMPSSPNFALTSQSPAINKGLPLSAVKTDFIGRLRQGAYDIGAYEY